jgi:NhaP-type Na+/H+ or K+/H+ antiporter
LLTGLTLAVVATSVVVHGISVTPLMRRYGKAEGDGVSG